MSIGRNALTVSGDGENRAVEDVHGDVDGVGRGGLTRVDARVRVLDVADDEARDGAAAGVVLEAVGGGGHWPGRQRRGGSGARVEEDHLQGHIIDLWRRYPLLSLTTSSKDGGKNLLII